MARIKKYMSQAEFTRHMEYKSRSYVTQLKASGRLVLNQHGLIDVEATKIRIVETADPNRDDVRNRHAAKREADKPAAEQKQEKKTKAKDPHMVTFSESRAQNEHWKALQAKSDYEKSIGLLVSKQEMQAAIADMVTTFRQSLENFPHRIAAELVGKDINEIRITLKQGVHDALHNLERDCNTKLNQQTEQAL